MWYLLQLEWLKQKKHRTFLLLCLGYIVLLPSMLLIAKSIKEWPPPINTPDTFFSFPDVFMYLGYVGNWLTFFLLGFLSVVYITQEFGNRTFRQNIINGLTRTDIFLSKVSFLIAVAFMATLYYGLVAMIMGLLHSDALYTSVIFKDIGYLPRFFVMCLGYMSFGLLLGTLLRRTGITLFLFFAYGLFIELILRWGAHLNIYEHRSMHFYPLNAFEDLVPIPLPQIALEAEKQLSFSIFLRPEEAMVLSLIYIVLFLMGTYALIRRRDL